MDGQGRPVAVGGDGGIEGREETAWGVGGVVQAGPHRRLPGQRAGEPLQPLDDGGELPPGFTLEAGPHGGVVAQPPGDEAAPAGADDRCGDQADGEDPPQPAEPRSECGRSHP